MSDEKRLKKFRKLQEEWRSEALSKPTEEIYKAVVTTAMNTVALEMAKEMDEDLQRLQEELKVAREGYTEGKKKNNLEIEFLIEILRGRGENVPDSSDFLRKAHKELVEN